MVTLTPATPAPEKAGVGWGTQAAGLLRGSLSTLLLKLGDRKRAHCSDRETDSALVSETEISVAARQMN